MDSQDGVLYTTVSVYSESDTVQSAHAMALFSGTFSNPCLPTPVRSSNVEQDCFAEPSEGLPITRLPDPSGNVLRTPETASDGPSDLSPFKIGPRTACSYYGVIGKTPRTNGLIGPRTDGIEGVPIGRPGCMYGTTSPEVL